MAWCHQAPSHYLNQIWLNVIKNPRNLYQCNLRRNAFDTNHDIYYKIVYLKWQSFSPESYELEDRKKLNYTFMIFTETRDGDLHTQKAWHLLRLTTYKRINSYGIFRWIKMQKYLTLWGLRSVKINISPFFSLPITRDINIILYIHWLNIFCFHGNKSH